MSSISQRVLELAAAESLQRIREDRERVEEDPVQAILAHLEEHLFDPDLNVNSLKDHCGIRDNSMPARFSSALGKTPRAYIEDRRMETAGRLLVDTTLTISRIAELVGYSGIQVFSRAFARWSRVRPTVYRREQRLRRREQQKLLEALPKPRLREIPIGNLADELFSLPEQLAAHPGAVTVTRRGEPVLAVMSWELFELLLEIVIVED